MRSPSCLAALASALVFLGACSSVPADPNGTLERVRGGTMRVGITHNPHWTDIEGPPSGHDVELVEGFAEQLDARIEWTEGSEQELFRSLEEGSLDLVIGGFEAANPYSAHAAFTTVYYEDRVMAVPFGENGWLVTLEKFLMENALIGERTSPNQEPSE